MSDGAGWCALGALCPGFCRVKAEAGDAWATQVILPGYTDREAAERHLDEVLAAGDCHGGRVLGAAGHYRIQVLMTDMGPHALYPEGMRRVLVLARMRRVLRSTPRPAPTEDATASEADGGGEA